MPIDIDPLTESESIDLNRRIVERLRFMQQVRTHATMLQFSIGDRAQFESGAGQTGTGFIVKYNQKSVSVLAEDGRRWRVGPGFLRPADDARHVQVTPLASLPGA